MPLKIDLSSGGKVLELVMVIAAQNCCQNCIIRITEIFRFLFFAPSGRYNNPFWSCLLKCVLSQNMTVKETTD